MLRKKDVLMEKAKSTCPLDIVQVNVQISVNFNFWTFLLQLKFALFLLTDSTTCYWKSEKYKIYENKYSFCVFITTKAEKICVPFCWVHILSFCSPIKFDEKKNLPTHFHRVFTLNTFVMNYNLVRSFFQLVFDRSIIRNTYYAKCMFRNTFYAKCILSQCIISPIPKTHALPSRSSGFIERINQQSIFFYVTWFVFVYWQSNQFALKKKVHNQWKRMLLIQGSK